MWPRIWVRLLILILIGSRNKKREDDKMDRQKNKKYTNYESWVLWIPCPRVHSVNIRTGTRTATRFIHQSAKGFEEKKKKKRQHANTQSSTWYTRISERIFSKARRAYVVHNERKWWFWKNLHFRKNILEIFPNRDDASLAVRLSLLSRKPAWKFEIPPRSERVWVCYWCYH